jgi:ketosteroid isomerase-like protein
MTTPTVADEDVATVRSVFDAFASRDLGALSTLFHQDGTWCHRNDDRLGGRHRGSDSIAAYLAGAAQLTAGILRPVPRSFMTDSAGRVCVLLQVSGTRPDGRTFNDPQVAVFTVQDGRVSGVEQYVGDPAAAAFWA